MTDARSSLADLLNAVAAKQPTPGGGAVAGVCGALAAAIGEMTLNYSIGRKSTAQFDAELTHVLGELHTARAMMLELVAEDQEAFAELTAARKLDDADASKAKRLAAAVENCIAVPRTIGVTALSMLRIVGPVVEKSNKWLLSDLAVCVELAMATVRTAQYSVRANLGDVDPERRAVLAQECDDHVRRGVGLVNVTLAKIAAASGVA
jgi:formiminotetrahydrofolate cyclodeaminase